MRGLARGLSNTLDISYDEALSDVLVWNFFMLSTYNNSCTAFVVNSPGGVFIAHNTDIEYLYNLGRAVIIFKPDEGLGYPFVSFFSPGFVGVGLGENLAGLTVVYSAAYPSERDYGLPPLMMVRKIMEECGSIEETIRAFQSFLEGRGRFAHNGANLTFIDFKTGQMVLVEIAPDRVEADSGMKWEDKKFVVATNHYHLMPERNKLLLKIEEDFNLESILKILSDHDGQEGGTNHTICRHKNLNYGTGSSHIFTDQFVFYYALGNPCCYWKDPTVLKTVRWKGMLEQG